MPKKDMLPPIERDGLTFQHIRTARRTAVAPGVNVYALCPECRSLIQVSPGNACTCGHIRIEDAGDRKIHISGGTDLIPIYRIDIQPDQKDESDKIMNQMEQVWIKDGLQKLKKHRTNTGKHLTTPAVRK